MLMCIKPVTPFFCHNEPWSKAEPRERKKQENSLRLEYIYIFPSYSDASVYLP